MPIVNLTRPDITLHLDDAGVIREAFVSNIAEEGMEAWVGRPWLETVGASGSDNVQSMMDDASTSGVSAFRHVLQRFPSGRELPIEYTTIRAPGEKGGLLVLGKNLQAMAELQSRLAAAQLATEREYWKLRDVETRYRLLFDASDEAVLMIGGEDLRIVDANPAAVRALGLAPGWEFLSSVPPGERDAFTSMLQRVRENGRAPAIVLHFGAGLAPWGVRASLIAAEPGLRYLLQISPAGPRAAEPAPSLPADLPIAELLEGLPDGFVVIDPAGTILQTNQAFLDMVQVGAAGGVRGALIARWLSQPGADMPVLFANVERHGTVRLFQTTLHGELGSETAVEVSAASTGEGVARRIALLLRDVGRRLPAADPVSYLDALMATVSEQLGKTPMLEVLKNSSDAVEWQMIRAALDRVDGNRTAAAELLGLSRQSLHTKLNRHAGAGDQLTGTG